MPAIVLVMRKKEGCNKMSKKTHFVTAPLILTHACVQRIDYRSYSWSLVVSMTMAMLCIYEGSGISIHVLYYVNYLFMVCAGWTRSWSSLENSST